MSDSQSTAPRRPKTAIDLTNRVYERLTVVAYAGMNQSKRRRHLWRCQCECGNVVETTTQTLQAGECRSCGCLTREINSAKFKTHGKSASREYKMWANAKQRCTNRNIPDYPHYGGRGIEMCGEWLESFASFYRDMGPCPDDCNSIDRIDVNGNYEPGNCRWSNPSTQSANTRRSVYVELNGETVGNDILGSS